MESGLLYITAVIVLVAVGFFFALFMSRFATREADQGWPQDDSATTLSDEAAHAENPVLVASPEEMTSVSAQ